MSGPIDVGGQSFRARLLGVYRGGSSSPGACIVVEALGFPGRILLPLNRVTGPDMVLLTDELQVKFPSTDEGNVEIKVVNEG